MLGGEIIIYEYYSCLSRSCWLEISLDNLQKNFTIIRRMTGPDVRIMPALKANAYGHGIVVMAQTLEHCGADYLALGVMKEAIMLRQNGVSMPIMILASNMVSEVANLYIQYDLIPTIMNFKQAEMMSKAAKDKMVKIFIKVETGFGRLGVNAEEMLALVKQIATLPNIKVEGIYTHMCSVDWPDKDYYSEWQFGRFYALIKSLKKHGYEIPFMQIDNSAGFIAHPEMWLTGVCPGRAIYGYSTLERRSGHPELTPVLTAWKSRLIHVNEVIGGKFSEGFTATRMDKAKKIGVMVGGLYDNISPLQAKCGYVLIRGKRVPVVVPPTLEYCILDLTDCPEAELGDEVVILGQQGDEIITMEDLLNRWQKSLTELLGTLNAETPRIYFKEGVPQLISCLEEVKPLLP